MISLLLALASNMWAGLLPPEPAFVRPPHTNHPYHIFVGWDYVTNADEYAIYTATNQDTYTRRISVPLINIFAVSNLYWPTVYRIAVVATNVVAESDYSLPIYWPWPKTNFVSIFIAGRGAPVMVDTNPSSLIFYRSKLSMIQSSTNMVNWFDRVMIIVTNPQPWTLKISATNNLDAYMKPD